MSLRDDLVAAQQQMQQAQDALLDYAERHPGTNAARHAELVENLNRAIKSYLEVIKKLDTPAN
jgi:F0F1-type ATP synthase membrane subunit b/b'